MATKKNLPQPRPQDRQKHPERWQSDLNPKSALSATRGSPAAALPATRPASEIKRVVRALRDFTRDELEQIPVVEPGSRLRGRAVYVDLGDTRRTAITAPSQTIAGEDSFYVAKASVDRATWNRLVGVKEPERRPPGRANERRAAARRPSEKPALPRPRADGATRMLEQGDNQLRGGRERSERRGAGPVRKAAVNARHRHARPH